MMLLFDFFVLLSKTWQFILCFSIIVVFHELGHFIPAKLFKCRVDKFYLFFNPGYTLWKKQIGETEYGIGWLPFGGYVKISGMIDESLDSKSMAATPQPYEFRSKPAWQRFIIMVGGVIVNVIIAIIIFFGLNLYYGKEYLPLDNVQSISATPNALFLGLQQSDQILKIDNQSVKSLEAAEELLRTPSKHILSIKRSNNFKEINISENQILKLPEPQSTIFFPSYPLIIDSVLPSAKIGHNSPPLMKGDTIIQLNKIPIQDDYAFSKILGTFKNQFVTLLVKRNQPQEIDLNKNDTVSVTIFADENGNLKIIKLGLLHFYKFTNEKLGIAASFSTGIQDGNNILMTNIQGFGEIISGKRAANESLGGVISIGNLFPKEIDWQRFWTLTAILSIVIAFFNILPIPALDGGHAFFLIIEMVSGKKIPDKIQEKIQIVGMILLLSLMVYALGLDFWRLFKN